MGSGEFNVISFDGCHVVMLSLVVRGFLKMYCIGGSLGSGEFGVVSRGRWFGVVCSPVEVAIKTL